MKNKELRDFAKQKNIKLGQIAEKLGMLDSNFSRILRHELSNEKKQEIMKIIDDLAENEVVE